MNSLTDCRNVIHSVKGLSFLVRQSVCEIALMKFWCRRAFVWAMCSLRMFLSVAVLWKAFTWWNCPRLKMSMTWQAAKEAVELCHRRAERTVRGMRKHPWWEGAATSFTYGDLLTKPSRRRYRWLMQLIDILFPYLSYLLSAWKYYHAESATLFRCSIRFWLFLSLNQDRQLQTKYLHKHIPSFICYLQFYFLIIAVLIWFMHFEIYICNSFRLVSSQEKWNQIRRKVREWNPLLMRFISFWTNWRKKHIKFLSIIGEKRMNSTQMD